jgi:hypothetical protein
MIGGALACFQDGLGKKLVGNWIGVALIPDDRVSLDYPQYFGLMLLDPMIQKGNRRT